MARRAAVVLRLLHPPRDGGGARRRARGDRQRAAAAVRLGWLPDGRMLVVSMRDRKMLRQEQSGELVEHADLSGVATGHVNDMVVAPTASPTSATSAST